jgi:ketosteroid isomerase-like protein
MRRIVLGCAGLALVTSGLMTTGCVAPDTHDADIKALKDNETQWNADLAAKDIEKIMAHYADDAVLITGGAPATSGKDAIRVAFKGMLGDPAVSLKFQPSKVEVAKSGDVGFTEGPYQLTLTDPVSKQVINDHGSYATTYRKASDGSWKAVVDIATSEVPPAAAAPSPAPTMMKK